MKNAVPKYKNLEKESLRSMKDTVKKKRRQITLSGRRDKGMRKKQYLKS